MRIERMQDHFVVLQALLDDTSSTIILNIYGVRFKKVGT